LHFAYLLLELAIKAQLKGRHANKKASYRAVGLLRSSAQPAGRRLSARIFHLQSFAAVFAGR
jgi:hypothetical protein